MKLAEAVSDWLNTDIKVRRIDIVLAVFGIFCVGYYAYYGGLLGGLAGGLMYVLVCMIALWML